jgi:hypothetical protein
LGESLIKSKFVFKLTMLFQVGYTWTVVLSMCAQPRFFFRLKIPQEILAGEACKGSSKFLKKRKFLKFIFKKSVRSLMHKQALLAS